MCLVTSGVSVFRLYGIHVYTDTNQGTDRTFIINPANTLTANLHGFQLNVCKEEKGDKHYDSRICKPTRRVNLKKGNTIDFTFGLTSEQSGILFYGILSS